MWPVWNRVMSGIISTRILRYHSHPTKYKERFRNLQNLSTVILHVYRNNFLSQNFQKRSSALTYCPCKRIIKTHACIQRSEPSGLGGLYHC